MFPRAKCKDAAVARDAKTPPDMRTGRNRVPVEIGNEEADSAGNRQSHMRNFFMRVGRWDKWV